MQIVLVSSDLTVMARVEGVARRRGASLQTAADIKQAVARAAEATADLVIVDLTCPGIDVGTLVRSLKSRDPSRPCIIAFGPHVHSERLQAAQQAGCDEVFSRGRFFAQLDDVVTVPGA